MERPETGFSSKRYLKLVGVSAHGEAVVGAGEELRAECEKQSYHTYALIGPDIVSATLTRGFLVFLLGNIRWQRTAVF